MKNLKKISRLADKFVVKIAQQGDPLGGMSPEEWTKPGADEKLLPRKKPGEEGYIPGPAIVPAKTPTPQTGAKSPTPQTGAKQQGLAPPASTLPPDLKAALDKGPKELKGALALEVEGNQVKQVRYSTRKWNGTASDLQRLLSSLLSGKYSVSKDVVGETNLAPARINY